jgi:hypothetical protein
MVMRTSLALGREHPRGRAIVHEAVIALCKVWTAYTLKRAIDDVASTSEQAYLEFGLDKAEILSALERLRDEIKGDETLAVAHAGRAANGPQLAIVVTKRKPRLRSSAIGETAPSTPVPSLLHESNRGPHARRQCR